MVINKLGHNSATYTHKKPGHQNTATRTNIMGGSTANKNWIHLHFTIVSNNNKHNANNTESSNYNMNTCFLHKRHSPHVAILDSGWKDHYLQCNANKNNISQKGYNPITVTFPNENKLTSTHKCKIPIYKMNAKAKSAHIIPALNKSLLSIEKICDANYTAVFTNKDVKICKSPLNIPENDTLLTGHRDAQNDLYVTDLNNNYTTHTANKVDHMQNSTTKNSITFLYLAAFSPAISTLTNAIKKKPGLTIEAIKKYVSNIPHVSIGRLDHGCM